MEIKFKDMKRLDPKVREGFYDEMFYIEKHKKKVRNHAERKVDCITHLYTKREIYTLVFAFFVGIYLWKYKPASMVIKCLIAVITFLLIYFETITVPLS